MGPGHRGVDASANLIPFVCIGVISDIVDVAFGNISVEEGAIDALLTKVFDFMGCVGCFKGFHCGVVGGVDVSWLFESSEILLFPSHVARNICGAHCLIDPGINLFNARHEFGLHAGDHSHDSG